MILPNEYLIVNLELRKIGMKKSQQDPQTLVVLGGMFALVMAMGIGRFAYTPLLPLMQREFKFGESMAGVLASVNYLGYLLGALACRPLVRPRTRNTLFRLSLVAIIVAVAAMGLTSSIAAWLLWRFLAGVASAGAFVISSTVVLDALAENQRTAWSGYFYSGVGVGIALSGLCVAPLDSWSGAHGAWIGFGILCLPLAWASWRWVVAPDLPQRKVAGTAGDTPAASRQLLPWLTAAYFCEGLGYIVSGTFMVSILRGTSSWSAGNRAWIIVGLTAAIFSIIWPYIARRAGLVRALIGAHGLQALGIVLPVVSADVRIAYLGTLLFGGTFMGITVLSLTLGKGLEPQHSGRVISTLTVVFGLGQIAGPTLAGLLAARTSSFSLPLVLAALVVASGGLLLAANWLFPLLAPRYVLPVRKQN